MGVRTGRQYLEGLRDGREIWLDGARVEDVTTHPKLAGTARAIAELYDLQHHDDLESALTEAAGETGERIGLSFLEPRSREDLGRRRTMIKTWADWNGGMLGRSPDFLNIVVTSYASAHEFFAQGGRQYGENVRSYWEWLRHSDLCLTHTFVHPQRDRSSAIPEATEEELASRVVRETDAGVIIRGARMLATLAPFSDELAVFPSGSRHLPETEEARQFAFAFCVPIATPGLRFICRKSLTPAGESALDFPFSSRLDEMDCVAIFEDVLVPWDRMFIYRNPYLTSNLSRMTGGHAASQAAIKDLAKAEFLLGIALGLSDAINVQGFPHVQNLLNEMIDAVELVRACVVASEAEALSGPNDTVIPNIQFLRPERFYFLEIYPRLVEILRILGAGGLMMAPGEREIRGPRSEDIIRYYQSATLPADRRLELFRLAVDAACSGFAGRQVLYERYFAGDPWRLASQQYQNYPLKEELTARVWSYLGRMRQWDARTEEKPL